MASTMAKREWTPVGPGTYGTEPTYEQLLEQVIRDQELERRAENVRTPRGKDHSDSVDDNGVVYQKCGGGRRVLRKRIGSN